MKKNYIVFKLTRVHNDVEMVLSEISDAPLPAQRGPTYQPDMNRIATPIPKTDEERVALGVLNAVKKFAPGLNATMLPMLPSAMMSAMGPRPRSQKYMHIIISLEEYKKLGSPALDETLILTLSKSIERGDG